MTPPTPVTPPQPKTAIPHLPATRAPATVPPALARFTGGYYVIPERCDSTILAIRPVVNRLPWFVRGVARNHLNSVNPPCASVAIQVTDPRTVAIGTDQWPTWQHKLSGPPIHWRRNAEEQYDVSLQFAHGGLEQRFVGAEGERINRYVLIENGSVLQMEVLVISPKLPQAVHYILTFGRM
ncbi:MAG: hypothetical protein JO069_00345 [Verrucomicrobia bacterium]|nr:hypothetical protein [Verrucomicrobiota bacterium]